MPPPASCVNNGRIRALTSRSDDAHSSSVVSIDAPLIGSPLEKGSNASGQKSAAVMLGRVCKGRTFRA